MLNKLKFNNLVITNKKKIQQGRIQTINKLVQKIRKLKSQLEKNPDNPKNKERLRKTAENLEYLKKIECSDVIKKILLLEKNPSTVITNGLSTPEEVALALIAQNKIIEDLIQIFREELDLSNTNLKWREELLEPSKRRAKINRTEEKKKKRKDDKEQKANERKRQDWIKHNNPYMEEAVSLSATGAWKVEEIELDMESSQISVNKTTLRKNFNEINDGKIVIKTMLKKDKFRKELKMLPIVEKNNKTTPEEINNEIISKNVKSALNKTNNRNDNYKKIEPVIDDLQKRETEPIVKYVVDPFFITDTGENYLATDVTILGEQQADDSTQKRGEINERGLVAKEEKNYTPSNRRLKNNKLDELYITTNLAHDKHKNESLHPSWAAKQKLKPIITSFQGKKITFEDDDIGRAMNTNKKVKPDSKKTGNIYAETTNAGQGKIHPSWAAKQKLKPTIAVFQGKKTSFTNEYED